MILPKREFMEAAIREAVKAKEEGDYAVGAVIVKNDKVIAYGREQIKSYNDPVLHAEVVAIREACRIVRSRHLKECVLYTTHEPCPMCSSADIWAEMKGIVFGARMEDMKEYGTENGNEEFRWRTIDIPASKVLNKGNPRLLIVEDFMRDECKALFHS